MQQERGIARDVLDGAGVFSEARGGRPTLLFPYVKGGSEIGVKVYQPAFKGDPKKYWQEPGKIDSLYNIDRAAPHSEIYWTEGEIDALAVITAGFENVVSVPMGANKEVAKEQPAPEDDNKFSSVWACQEHLDGKRHIIATDNDEAGIALREELVRRLGRGNCELVLWPDGVKDANEFLLKFGPQELNKHLYSERIPYPIAGLAGWDGILDTGDRQTWAVPLPLINHHIKLAAGTLGVATGIPNHGKSQFMKNMACAMIQRYGWRVCMAGFEDDISQDLKPELLTIYKTMSAKDEAAPDIRKRMCFIYDDGTKDDTVMDLEWLCDQIRDAVRRYHINLVIIDPWNELEHTRERDEAETAYIGRALRELKRLAKERNIAIWIVAHPNKVESGRTPSLYDVSGSAHWANKVDYGVVVHNPDPDGEESSVCMADIHIKKIKRKAFGKRGVVKLEFYPATGTYGAIR